MKLTYWNVLCRISRMRDRISSGCASVVGRELLSPREYDNEPDGPKNDQKRISSEYVNTYPVPKSRLVVGNENSGERRKASESMRESGSEGGLGLPSFFASLARRSPALRHQLRAWNGHTINIRQI